MSHICHICLKNPASSHLSEMSLAEDELTELHLCASCCSTLHLDLSTKPVPIADILNKAHHLSTDDSNSFDIGNADDSNAADTVADESTSQHSQQSPSTHCPQCEITFEQFSSNNRFGCAHDYTVFADTLNELFQDLHGAQQHLGRGPQHNTIDESPKNRIADRMRLEKILKQSIAEERYEEAAAIRDQIKELEQ